MNTLKRVLGIIIIAILLGLASEGARANGTSEAPTGTSEAPTGTSGSWTSFVLHVRQGTVSGAVVGGRCKGETQEGVTRTVGCARRRPSVEGAWLDGECWITVRDWDGPISREIIVGNWGHELGHCVEGAWHE